MIDPLLLEEFEKTLEAVLDRMASFNLELLLSYGLQKVELMFMDSAIKGMPVSSLHKTLLITEDNFNKMIHKLTFILVDVFYNGNSKHKRARKIGL